MKASRIIGFSILGLLVLSAFGAIAVNEGSLPSLGLFLIVSGIITAGHLIEP